MKAKNCIVTGASGFLGRYVQNTLTKEGYNVITLGRSADSTYRVDIATSEPRFCETAEIVIHIAGLAHIVPKTNAENQKFFDVNVKGTRHLLSGLESGPGLPRAFVFISSVSVYGQDLGSGIDETHPLMANDAYGRSKIEAEQLVSEWCEKNDVKCAILRIPLLVGKTPPGNLGAMISGIKKGYYFNIDGGRAKKSMVLAKAVAEILVSAAAIGGIYNLTDGHHPSFKELSGAIAASLKKKHPLNLPYWIAWILAKFGDIAGNRFPINSNKLKKIVSDLTFDDTRAQKELGWKHIPVLQSNEI